ncbi:MAG: VOC family protein [Dehalococcoidia bacterium]
MTIAIDPELLSRLPSEFDHLGFVWKDIEAAAKRFERLLGVRFTPPGPGSAFPVNRPSGTQLLEMRAAHAQFGPIKLEFVQPLGPSIYSEHIERYGEGLHHVGFDTKHIDQFLARYEELGVIPAMFGEFGSTEDPSTFAYFDTLTELGVLTEVVDFSPTVRARLDAARAQAAQGR